MVFPASARWWLGSRLVGGRLVGCRDRQRGPFIIGNVDRGDEVLAGLTPSSGRKRRSRSRATNGSSGISCRRRRRSSVRASSSRT